MLPARTSQYEPIVQASEERLLFKVRVFSREYYESVPIHVVLQSRRECHLVVRTPSEHVSTVGNRAQKVSVQPIQCSVDLGQDRKIAPSSIALSA